METVGGSFCNRPTFAIVGAVVVVVAVVIVVVVVVVVAAADIVAIMIIIMIIIAAADFVVSILQGLAADWFPQGPVSSSIRIPVR